MDRFGEQPELARVDLLWTWVRGVIALPVTLADLLCENPMALGLESLAKPHNAHAWAQALDSDLLNLRIVPDLAALLYHSIQIQHPTEECT